MKKNIAEHLVLFFDTKKIFMETKIFVHHSAEAAEKELNKWLQSNDVNIQYIGQSQSEQAGRFVFIVSVFYLKNERFKQLQTA